MISRAKLCVSDISKVQQLVLVVGMKCDHVGSTLKTVCCCRESRKGNCKNKFTTECLMTPSICKQAQTVIALQQDINRDILNVGTRQLGPDHCILMALVSLSQDNSAEGRFPLYPMQSI